MKCFYVYIMANGKRGTLYTGVTSDLKRRVFEHRTGRIEGFTKKHNLRRLVYFETIATANEAIYREKQIKKWRREWKLELIENANADWEYLYEKGL